jgi:hypothetical protein
MGNLVASEMGRVAGFMVTLQEFIESLYDKDGGSPYLIPVYITARFPGEVDEPEGLEIYFRYESDTGLTYEGEDRVG